MSIMTMNMCSGKLERETPVASEYDDEILSSGWNPVIGLAQLVPETRQHALPAELANADIEQFLRKMYG